LLDWLYRALRQAILDGRLPAGAVLPGTRVLAQQYGVARGTAQAAYRQLLSEGYLETHLGSGTRVCATVPDRTLRAPAAVPPALCADTQPPALGGTLLASLGGLPPPFPLLTHAEAMPFFPHRCDVGAFPIDVWRKLCTRQLRESRRHILYGTEMAGLPGLRAAIARHLGIARGVSVSPDQIVVLGSVQQALDLCTRLLVAPGEQVWIEDPGYPGARQAMLAAGARLVDVPIDPDGMCVEQAIQAAPGARLAYVTPARQAPLGVALSPARRHALLQWARERGSYIFEDDYDSEYRFVAKPIPALRSLAGSAQHVVLAGTFSKLLFPGIRLAFVALPEHLVPPFLRALSLTARQPNGLMQAVLADFIDDGHFDRHMRRMRRVYASRADAFLTAARRHWAGLLEVPVPQAGLDLVAPLVAHDEADAMQRLASAGIVAMPLQHYRGSTEYPPALVLGFAPFTEEAIDAGARRMADALRAGRRR
jgi:GntR family transcriptional regulator/MocR family aminotransferase